MTTNDDLRDIVRAMATDAATSIKCDVCHGTGTVFKGARSVKCPQCGGTAKIVLVPRSDLRLPMTPEWRLYFASKK